MAHTIKDLHWRDVEGRPRIYFKLDDLGAFMSSGQKRPILRSGFVFIQPFMIWEDRLPRLRVPANPRVGLEVGLEMGSALESNRLALSALALSDAISAGTWQQNPLFRGRFTFDEAGAWLDD